MGRAVKVFVFALDGMNPKLMKRFIGEGAMPFLDSLMQKGAFSVMESTDPPLTPTAWTSIFTGMRPENHGVYDFICKRDDGSFTPVNSTNNRGNVLWDLLGKHDKKSIVCFPPITYPTHEINGVILSDHLFTPYNAKEKTFPSSVAGELESAIGTYKVFSDVTYDKNRIPQLLNDFRDEVEFKLKASKHLMATRQWDLFILYTWSLDNLQHSLSHIMDSSHPLFDSGLNRKHYPEILTLASRLDAAIKEICESLDEDTTVLIVSDHGFCNVSHYIYLNTWLLQNGYIRLRKGLAAWFKKTIFNAGFTPENAYKLVNHFGSFIKRTPTDSRFISLLSFLFLSLDDLDWDETLAFSKGNFGQIFLNRKRKSPETDSQISARLTSDLLAWRDAANGNAVVHTVLEQTAIFSAPDRNAPDLLVYSNENGYKPLGTIDFNSNKTIGAIFGITGHHDKNAVFLCHGPNIKAGIGLQNVKTEDVLPTIFAILDLPVPDNVDGRVPDGLFSGNRKESRESAQPKPATEGRHEYTLDEQEEIKARLKGLGYM